MIEYWVFRGISQILTFDPEEWPGTNGLEPGDVVYEPTDKVTPWYRVDHNRGYYPLKDHLIPGWCKAYALLLT